MVQAVKPDPDLSWLGHPVLPAGLNADDLNGDDYDGAGTNWPIWPTLFDTFVGFQVLIITDEMLDAFDNLCADYVLACDPWEVAPSFIDSTTVSGPEWITQMVLPQRSTLVAPPRPREKAPTPDWDALVPVSASWQLSLQAEANTAFLDQDWGVHVVSAEENTWVLPYQPREANFAKDWKDSVPADVGDTAVLTREPNTQTMRKKP